MTPTQDVISQLKLMILKDETGLVSNINFIVSDAAWKGNQAARGVLI